jgi:hypothetical protein
MGVPEQAAGSNANGMGIDSPQPGWPDALHVCVSTKAAQDKSFEGSATITPRFERDKNISAARGYCLTMTWSNLDLAATAKGGGASGPTTASKGASYAAYRPPGWPVGDCQGSDRPLESTDSGRVTAQAFKLPQTDRPRYDSP